MEPTNNSSALEGTSQAMEMGQKISESAQKIDKRVPARIFRVPEELRKLKTSAYTPRLVSIGPLHSKDEHLSSEHMQDIKRCYVNSLFNKKTRGNDVAKGSLLMNCLEEMGKSKEKAKEYYAENVDAELNEEMLLIDGCFILEVLFRYSDLTDSRESSDQKVNNQPSNDPIFDCALTRVTVQHDLLLLENQLPFFVLEKLFDLTVSDSQSSSLDHYVVTYFGSIMSSGKHNPKNRSIPGDSVLSVCYCETNYHILHLLHNHYLPNEPKEKGQIEFMPSASDLHYAGVKFEARTGEDLFNVEFKPRPRWSCHRARFEIPKLCINDSTEPLLRNLIAFEQCCPRVPFYFTSYAALMNALIDDEKDVEVLEKAEVIRNDLGANEDACKLFNRLCREIVVRDFYFAKNYEQAAHYSNRRWPNFMAQLRRKYFASPWSIIAFCVAIIASGMSVTSFVRSFLR